MTVKIPEDRLLKLEDTSGYQIAQLIAQLQERVAGLEAALARIEKGVNRSIEWEEQTSPSGIQLQGLSKITRKGTLISITPQVVGPGNISVFCVVRNENGELGIINGPFKFVD